MENEKEDGFQAPYYEVIESITRLDEEGKPTEFKKLNEFRDKNLLDARRGAIYLCDDIKKKLYEILNFDSIPENERDELSFMEKRITAWDFEIWVIHNDCRSMTWDSKVMGPITSGVISETGALNYAMGWGKLKARR